MKHVRFRLFPCMYAPLPVSDFNVSKPPRMPSLRAEDKYDGFVCILVIFVQYFDCQYYMSIAMRCMDFPLPSAMPIFMQTRLVCALRSALSWRENGFSATRQRLVRLPNKPLSCCFCSLTVVERAVFVVAVVWFGSSCGKHFLPSRVCF